MAKYSIFHLTLSKEDDADIAEKGWIFSAVGSYYLSAKEGHPEGAIGMQLYKLAHVLEFQHPMDPDILLSTMKGANQPPGVRPAEPGDIVYDHNADGWALYDPGNTLEAIWEERLIDLLTVILPT